LYLCCGRATPARGAARGLGVPQRRMHALALGRHARAKAFTAVHDDHDANRIHISDKARSHTDGVRF